MTDIRKGDLIRATNKSRTEEVIQGRVTSAPTRHWVYLHDASIPLNGQYNLEVLDRPIEEELLKGAAEALDGLYGLGFGGQSYESAAKTVIEFVRQYDKENSK